MSGSPKKTTPTAAALQKLKKLHDEDVQRNLEFNHWGQRHPCPVCGHHVQFTGREILICRHRKSEIEAACESTSNQTSPFHLNSIVGVPVRVVPHNTDDPWQSPEARMALDIVNAREMEQRKRVMGDG